LKNTSIAGIDDMGGTVKAANAPTTGGAHPIYSLMQPKEGASTKKKIVIPPKGAW
jgi:hypothetical protein